MPAKWTGKKQNVMFTKPEEPSFLKKFKERVGYKEDKGVMEKFEEMPKATDDDLEDQDDELPTVVQLSPDDMSQEEFSAIVEKEVSGKQKEGAISKDSVEGEKILFRKPAGKRDHENDLKASTKKAKHSGTEEDKSEEEKTKKEKKKEKSNKTLLSFEDDDEEDST